MADHHLGHEQQIEACARRRRRRPTPSASILLCVVVLAALVATNVSAESENKNRPNLFSQVNNWFSRLRGNRDNNNGNDDKKNSNDDKKEETSTKQAVPMYAMPGMAPGFMTPYGAPMMAAPGPNGAGSPMFGMALPTNQFVNHAVPGAAHGGPRPLPMAFNPMAMGPAMSANPFAFGGAHMMPVHHSDPYSDPMGSHHHPHHHHPHHHGESFGSFSPYAGFGQSDSSSGDESGSYYPGGGGGGSSTDTAHDEDYGYGKNKK